MMKTSRSKLVPLPKLIAETQKVFNKWIRERDSYGYGRFACISCNEVSLTTKMDAGHYVPVSRSSFLRFHPDNVHGECKKCNGFDKFHLVGYRKNLIEKIGLERVEWLEENSHKLKKWTREELLEIQNSCKKDMA